MIIIHLYGGSFRKKTNVGFYIKGTIKFIIRKVKKKKNKKLKRIRKGQLFRSLVCRSKFKLKNLDNSFFFFFQTILYY